MRPLTGKFWVVCALLLLPGAAWASVLEESLSACSGAGELLISEAEGPAETERKIEQAQVDRVRACGAAEDALAQNEKRVRAMKQAVDKLPAAVHQPDQRADRLVRAELQSAKEIIQQLDTIPNEVTDDNNKLLHGVDGVLSGLSRRSMDLAAYWNQIFLPEPGGPLDIVEMASRNPEVSETAREQYADYLRRLPAYLIGRGPAPRQRVELLQLYVELAGQAAQLKTKTYTMTERRRISEQLQAELDPEVADSLAKSVATKLQRDESYRNSTWARAALIAGACTLARSVVTEQASAVNAALELAPSSARSSFDSALATRLAEKRSFVEQAVCDRPHDLLLLHPSLARWQRTLPQLCAGAGSGVQARMEESLADIASYFEYRNSLSGRDELEILQDFGEELWSRGHYVAILCVRRRP
ncbi:hypothetical protein [Mesorhizobium sp. M0909]|uniref:hypothetical protein n=1 Tax=Mesorhizobium sp. M0909 TaxID=2957024 RepID=UPI0033366812